MSRYVGRKHGSPLQRTRRASCVEDVDEGRLNHGVTETLRKDLFKNFAAQCLGG